MQTDSSKEFLCLNCGNPKQSATLLLHFLCVQEVELVEWSDEKADCDFGVGYNWCVPMTCCTTFTMAVSYVLTMVISYLLTIHTHPPT
jgi:hypothetical protein